MDDEIMRKLLLRKLNDPEWKAKQARQYRQIMGEREITFAPRQPHFRETILPSATSLPKEEEPGTVEALWMGNWQRSSGALTITRFPDDTVLIDYPDGSRIQFRPCPAPRNLYSWSSESHSPTGRLTENYRCPDRFASADEALLGMHQAALAMYSDAAAEADA